MHWNIVLLNVLPACINAGLLLYTLFVLPTNRTNNLFAIFIFLLSAEQFADGMMHIARTQEAAAMWQHIALTPWIFIAPIGVLFILSITQYNPRREASWHQSVLLIPALICQIIHSAHLDRHEMVYDETWGWIGNPGNNPATLLVLLFIVVTGLLMPMLLIRACIQNRKTTQYKNKFLLLAIGVTAPYVGGVLGEVLLPITFGVNEIPLASPLMTLFTIASVISIARHKLLDFSPMQQFDRILETMTEGVLIVGHDGLIKYANPSLGVILRTEEKKLAGKQSEAILLHPELQAAFQHLGKQELQLQSANGESIWVEVSISPCIDGKGKEIGFTCIVTDIDQLKKSAAILSRNEIILNRAQEVAHVGSWEFSYVTGKSSWSEEACRIYGFDPKQTEMSFNDWLSRIHPLDLNTVMMRVRQSQETKCDTDFEFRIILPDGTVKYIQSISKYECDAEGKPLALFGICKDVTEIKMAERNLRTTSRELETYIYKSSHDLHAPLATIMGLVNVSKLDVKDEVASRYLEMIEWQAKKLDSVRVEFIKAMNIKDATRLDEEVHLNRMIGEILRDLRVRDGFSRVNINVNVSPELKLVSNEFLMRTILQNLIDNSIKYQDTARAQPQVLIDLERRGNTTCITVEDNGIGIDPSLHEKIFDMYFRTEESGTGSGLGLYLVKKAVEKLDATMSLRSSPGQGSRFTLSFVQAN